MTDFGRKEERNSLIWNFPSYLWQVEVGYSVPWKAYKTLHRH